MFAERERTGFGEKRTSSITRRAGSETLSIGTEIFPLGRRIWPPGPPAATGDVGADVAPRVPPSFRAATATRSERPTSAEVAAYVRAVAPAVLAQLPPFPSQRCHWYANDIGCVPSQLPGLAVSTSPSRGVPEIEGGAVLRGATAARWIVPVFAEAFVAPSRLRAVTTTTSRRPRSALPSG